MFIGCEIVGRIIKFQFLIFILFISNNESIQAALIDNINLRPRQVVSETTREPRFQSPNKNQDSFHLISVDSESVIIGAKDAVYNLSATNLEPKYTIHWKALGQTIEECHMKGKSESECHNFIRVVTKLRNGRTLICGTHAFSPQCREYEFAHEEDRLIEREQFNGQALSPYDPKHNSTYYYSEELNEIFVGTVSDIGANDALIYRKRLPKGDSLRTQKDDRVIDFPHFVGSFQYKDYVYFWYREQAAESQDNNKEPQYYARVGRVCAAERGGPSPAQDRWSSFLKARLNCSIPDQTTSFYFNEIQSISEPIDDGKGDLLIYAVFQTSRSLLLSAVCVFRMSQINAIFDYGRFKTQRTPSSLWAPSQKYYASDNERPGRCVADSQRLADISFIVKNPLMYDLVPSEGQRPLLVEGPGRPAITSISVQAGVPAVRNQRHDVVYIGREDGTVAKLVETSINQTSVLIENIRVFDNPGPIIGMKSISPNAEINPFGVLIVARADQVVQLPLEHCSLQQSCSLCVRLRDPHCAWDVDSLRCVYNKDWSRGSYIQNILMGVSEQCPDNSQNILNDAVYTVDDGPVIGGANPRFNGPPSSHTIGDLTDGDGIAATKGLHYANNGNLPLIVLAVLISSIGGFLIGYRISKWRILSKLTRNAHSSSGSSASSGASDDYGHVYAPSTTTRNRLSRAPSIIQSSAGGKSLAVEHYSQAPMALSKSSNAGDAVSLVFGHGHPQHFVPMPLLTSVSNGGSGMATPRHDARTLMLLSNNNNNNNNNMNNNNNNGATLPRDYKVKKVYL